jgi:hypothetical protein
MRINGRLIILLLTTLLLTSGFQKKVKYDFAFLIGNCYKSDTLRIRINGIQVIDSLIAKTDSTGYANISVLQSNEGLFVFWRAEEFPFGGKRKKLERIEFKKEIEFELLINGIKTSSKIDIRNGIILIADRCSIRIENEKVSQRLTIRQFKTRQFKRKIKPS